MRVHVGLVCAIFFFCDCAINISHLLLVISKYQVYFPILTENTNIRGMTLALRSLNQQSQSQSGDVGTRTRSPV